MATAAAHPTVMLVATDPLVGGHLLQALREDGFQVLQRPRSHNLAAILPAGGDPTPQLLILQQSLSRPSDVRSVTALVQAVRRQTPALPLLLLMDRAEEAQRAAVLDAGADDVMQQPFGLREVIARCRAILRRSRGDYWSSLPSAPGHDLLQVGPISLDRRECRVTLAGEEVTLTRREFRLLECFMLNPGQAMSREQLIERVWGPDFAGDSKSVDVHVLWLRRKLDVAGPRPELFITVRGIGYRLDPPRD